MVGFLIGGLANGIPRNVVTSTPSIPSIYPILVLTTTECPMFRILIEMSMMQTEYEYKFAITQD